MPVQGTGVQSLIPWQALLSRPFEEQDKDSSEPVHCSPSQARETECQRGILLAPRSHSKWAGTAGTQVLANEAEPSTLGNQDGLLQAYPATGLRWIFFSRTAFRTLNYWLFTRHSFLSCLRLRPLQLPPRLSRLQALARSLTPCLILLTVTRQQWLVQAPDGGGY